MSVLRPSVALGTLQQALLDRGIAARSLYLNILFAQEIGLDLNEGMIDRLPTHLLLGEWLFAAALGSAPAVEQAKAYRRLLQQILGRNYATAERVREDTAPKFVARAAQSITEARPAAVGFTLMFQQTAASLAIAKAVKGIDPQISICFGGANCHGPMGAVLLRHFEQIDYVFTGEADESFPVFVQRLLAGAPLADLGGVIGRNGAAAIGTAPPVVELDRLPIPNYDDYFEQLGSFPEADRVRSSVPFESARGCWWGQKQHCTFCGLNGEGMAFRSKSPERVLAELDTLAHRYGVRRFSAADNILAMAHIASVMAPLANRAPHDRPGLLFYEVKSNLNERQLAILAKAGVVWMQPGIESLADDILRIMRKGVTALLNVRLLRNCRELGIGLLWNMLHGFPGETAEAYRRMAAFIPLLEHLQPPKGCFPIRLDRFSPNFESAAELGFSQIAPAPAYAAIFDLPAAALRDMAYFFEGFAANVADERSVALLKTAIVAWWHRWHQITASPMLQSHNVAPGKLIIDTRQIAVAPAHYLDAEEAAMLDCLRDPVAGGDLRRNGGDSTLRRLLELKLVLELDGVMLSLVTESERQIHAREVRADFPLGYFVGSPNLPVILEGPSVEPINEPVA
jgi:ribosomal peptide maturation radical SAM protein 1